MDTAAIRKEIEEMIKEKVRDIGRPDLYREPMVGFVSVDDPSIVNVKDIVGPWHDSPDDQLPGARTIIAYTVPFTREVAMDPGNAEFSGLTWSEAYVIINKNFELISKAVADYLRSKGYEAATVTSLGEVFKGNTTIKKFAELYYFTGVKDLNDDAFNGCVNLASLRLPKGLKTIGARALKDCKKLPQLNLPTGINAIGEEAFAGCALLADMELSNEITTIEKGTFKNCAALTTFNLPISISSIGSEAFAGCNRIKTFYVNTYHPSDITMGEAVFENIDLSAATLHVMQGTKSFFESTDQWKAFGKIEQTRDISGGKFTDLEAGKTYYIYNVGTGRYLTKGEAYGTQSIVGTSPMRFKAIAKTNSEGVYYFSSPDTGNNGKYLFRTSSDGNVGQGVKAVFVDGSSLGATAYWSVKQAGNQIYTIQVPSTDASYVEGEYLGVQTDHESNAATPTYGTYYDVEYNSHKLNCQWQFVLYDEASSENFKEAQTLEKLITTAKRRNVKCDEEQAVYDNLESTTEELLAAQSSLRKKLKFIEFSIEA